MYVDCDDFVCGVCLFGVNMFGVRIEAGVVRKRRRFGVIGVGVFVYDCCVLRN